MLLFFFFNDTATTEIYTLSLHDALPILSIAAKRTKLASTKTLRPFRPGKSGRRRGARNDDERANAMKTTATTAMPILRSEEHTSELQSQSNLVCRLLLEKKKTDNKRTVSDSIRLPTSTANKGAPMKDSHDIASHWRSPTVERSTLANFTMMRG